MTKMVRWEAKWQIWLEIDLPEDYKGSPTEALTQMFDEMSTKDKLNMLELEDIAQIVDCWEEGDDE